MSGILENWENGLGFPGVLVIDGHVHIGEWPHATTFRNVEEAVEESAAFMDANGIDAAWAQSGGYFKAGTDYRLGNDFLLEVTRRLSDRLVGFMCVNPNDGRANILAELDRMYGEGIRCIKLINNYQENYPGDGPNLMALYEYAAKNRMLVFNHGWSIAEIEHISAEFPDTDFVFGHYGGGQDGVLRERKNVYANIWNYAPLGFLDQAVASVGAGKLMLGSDGFLNPMSVGIGPVVFMSIDDDEKRLILGLTAARLLDKVGALPGALKVIRDKYLRAKGEG